MMHRYPHIHISTFRSAIHPCHPPDEALVAANVIHHLFSHICHYTGILSSFISPHWRELKTPFFRLQKTGRDSYSFHCWLISSWRSELRVALLGWREGQENNEEERKKIGAISKSYPITSSGLRSRDFRICLLTFTLGMVNYGRRPSPSWCLFL